VRKIALITVLFLITANINAQEATFSDNQKAGELSFKVVTVTRPDGSTYDYYHIMLKMVVECRFPKVSLTDLVITNLDEAAINNNYKWTFDSFSNKITVADPCIAFSSPPCYRVYYYHVDADLPYNDHGYRLFYADCCRNFFNNLRTGYNASSYDLADIAPAWACGADSASNFNLKPCLGYVYNSIVYLTNIPSRFKKNSKGSPIFNNADTILYVCANKPFSHLFNAQDPNNLSLAYSFGISKIWSAVAAGNCCVQVDAGPNIINAAYKEPGYTPAQPLGKDVTIDAATGLLKGVLHDTGTYLLTLAVDQYAGNEKWNLTPHTRDVVIKVFDCASLPTPKAALPALINDCVTNTITLPNNSTPYYPELTWDNTKYLWDLGDGAASTERYPVHTYDTGTYNLRLITMPGYHCADTANTRLLVYPAIHPGFAINGQPCTGSAVKFTSTATTQLGSINDVAWTFVNMHDSSSQTIHLGSARYTFSAPDQTYQVVLAVSTTKGCMAKDTQYIDIWRSPQGLQTHDTVLTAGQPYQLIAGAGDAGAGNTFKWWPVTALDNPYIANPVTTAGENITYTVQIKNGFGCSLTDTIRLTYYKGPDIYLPNAFTPNGDGLNDILRPFAVGMKKLEYFRVFNRLGNIVFKTETFMAGWDGMVNGSLAPAGTYIYEVNGIDSNNKRVVKKGTIVLIR